MQDIRVGVAYIYELVTTIMETYQFYKSIYDRELNRRKDLDAAINLPMTLLSIIVAANSYLVKESDWTNSFSQTCVEKILIPLTAMGLGASIFYLTKSYNNFFKGFAYRNLGLTTEIRKYENALEKYNQNVDEEKRIKFENVVVDKLTTIIDGHIVFNDRRSHDLYSAKTFLIICIMLTILSSIVFSLKFLRI